MRSLQDSRKLPISARARQISRASVAPAFVSREKRRSVDRSQGPGLRKPPQAEAGLSELRFTRRRRRGSGFGGFVTRS
jgi:hypothetical protein